MKLFPKNQLGVAAVEFAILAPLLFLILFGIINWGVLLYDKAVITNAAREGARWAAIHTVSLTFDSTGASIGCDNSVETTPDDPCAVAYSYAAANLITFGGTPAVTSVFTGSSTNYALGDTETVSTSYGFTGIGYGATAIIGGAGSLKATSIMYHE